MVSRSPSSISWPVDHHRRAAELTNADIEGDASPAGSRCSKIMAMTLPSSRAVAGGGRGCDVALFTFTGAQDGAAARSREKSGEIEEMGASRVALPSGGLRGWIGWNLFGRWPLPGVGLDGAFAGGGSSRRNCLGDVRSFGDDQRRQQAHDVVAGARQRADPARRASLTKSLFSVWSFRPSISPSPRISAMTSGCWSFSSASDQPGQEDLADIR